MKIPSHVASFLESTSDKRLSSLSVCLHIVRTARTDVRLMRTAATLREAGCKVSIVDVEIEHTRPVEENIDGVRMKHIGISGWQTSKSFEPWFFLNAARAFLLAIP